MESNPISAVHNPPSREVVIAVRGLTTRLQGDFWGRPKARAGGQSGEVRRGEVFGLPFGPNGSSKSTTVKMLLGLRRIPPRGTSRFLAIRPARTSRPTVAHRCYLPEESGLYRYLNSHEMLDFFGNLFRLLGGERDKRAEQRWKWFA